MTANLSNPPVDPTESAADREIVLTRTFDAPRELVWEAMTTPEHLNNWWGPRGFSTKIEVMDLRVGGKWKHVMRGPDGTEYPNKSVFTEVTRPEKIAYDHSGGRQGGPYVSFRMTWTLEEPEPGKTTLTLRQVFDSSEMRDRIVKEFGAIEGGKQTFARLAEHLAGRPVVVERTFRAPVALVWQALTEVGHMRQWFFETIPAFEPVVGFEAEFTVDNPCDKGFIHQWRVIEAVPEHRLALDWKYQGFPGMSHLTIELTPAGDRTHLKLVHAGLDSLEPGSHPDMMRGNFVKGWSHFIDDRLKNFLEQS